MAEEVKEPVIEDKTTISKTETTAPVADESVAETTKPVDVEETVDEALMLLNIMDQEVGGKGEIPSIPEEMRGSIKYLIENITFVRELFEDPLFSTIVDDMADQKEDGKTPSVEVAIARNIPLDKIQALAEGEDYEGAQNELATNLAASKAATDEESAYEASFEESRKNGEAYAAKMGYDEAETAALLEELVSLFKIMADGVITEDEFEKVDKMRNYDKDMADVIGQLPEEDLKEVLPDKASVETTIEKTPQKTKATKVATGPGMSSMGAYTNVGTDVTEVGKRKRK